MTDPGATVPEERARRHHGAKLPRGLAEVPRSTLYEGFFGRMFRSLPPLRHEESKLIDLGCDMFTDVEDDAAEDAGGDGDPGNNRLIEAGYTYLGQFIDHDITFDPTSRLQRDNDPEALNNFRTPRYDLDSVYGAGPDGDPFLYEYKDAVHLRTGWSVDKQPDLLRTPGDTPEEQRALIPDPRNDENLIISQLHLAFINYHNKVADVLQEEHEELAGDLAEWLARTQRIVRWHYQWIVVHEFLTRIVGEEVVKDVLGASNGTSAWLESYPVWTYKNGPNQEPRATLVKPNLRFFEWRYDPFVPVEFAAAAFRFGHSMVRDDYAMNEETSGEGKELVTFLKPSDKARKDLSGFRQRPSGTTIEWRRFFNFPDLPGEKEPRPKPPVQMSRLIDTKLATRLGHLPRLLTVRLDPSMRQPLPAGSTCANVERADEKEPVTIAPFLATRNLLRGQALGLPSGQAVATAMGLPKDLILGCKHFNPPPNPEANQEETAGDKEPTKVIDEVFWEATPLWYYILKEAEYFNGGKRLGPVGGRIVAEVLIGLLYGDPHSYLRLDPAWTPKEGEFGARWDQEKQRIEFGMPELLRFPSSTTKDTQRAANGRVSQGPDQTGLVGHATSVGEAPVMDQQAFDALEDSKFTLRDVWREIVKMYGGCEKDGNGPLPVTPALSLSRRKVTPGEIGQIPMAPWKGTILYHVESKSPHAILAFTRGRVTTTQDPPQEQWGKVVIYKEDGKITIEDPKIVENQTIYLGVGDQVMVHEAAYQFQCITGTPETANGAYATLLMAVISDQVCAGQPCQW
jgi:hypothetical protein